jgi:hypothetical protein
MDSRSNCLLTFISTTASLSAFTREQRLPGRNCDRSGAIFSLPLFPHLREIRGAKVFHLFFLLFPQGSLILHSFCTSQHQFSVAHESAFAQSAHSANVSCLEPARDCCRAGGDRWFSRVNHREGFQKCASVRSRKLGRCGLLRESFPKKLDWRRPLTQSLQASVP